MKVVKEHLARLNRRRALVSSERTTGALAGLGALAGVSYAPVAYRDLPEDLAVALPVGTLKSPRPK